MSDAHHEESAIKTPKQLILAVVAGFLVPIVAIVLLVIYVTNDRHIGAGSDGLAPEAVAQRIKPIADEGFTLKDPSAPKVLKSADEVYKATCAACHTSGAAGAPKLGDEAGWKARIAQGYDTLAKHAIEGLRAMPPKGGNPDLDDIEVERVVVMMANSAGAKFKEPAVPAPKAPTEGAPSEPAAPTAPAANAPAAAPAK
jgi:cytochrome c5